jgi:hypothetical protein
MTDRIDEVRDKAIKTWDNINAEKVYLDYGLYSKYRRKIIMNE